MRTTRHHIELTRDPQAGLTLIMNGMVQLSEALEHRYHESLAVVPMLFGHSPRVFVGGGGDGLAATRLLRFPEVESLVVCDIDPEMTRLARSHPELARLNADSLADPRVQVVNDDARAWLEASEQTFDLVVCDFFDPVFPETGPLYTRELYALVAERLAPGGRVVVQTLCIPECARIIQATLRAVFPEVRYYHPFPQHGFSLAARAPLSQVREVPGWTRFLAPEMAASLFVLPKDERADLAPRGDAVNTDPGEALVRATLAAMARPELVQPDDTGAEVLSLVGDAGSYLSPRQQQLLVEGLAERGPIALALDDARAESLADTLAALGFERSEGGLWVSAQPSPSALGRT